MVVAHLLPQMTMNRTHATHSIIIDRDAYGIINHHQGNNTKKYVLSTTHAGSAEVVPAMHPRPMTKKLPPTTNPSWSSTIHRYVSFIIFIKSGLFYLDNHRNGRPPARHGMHRSRKPAAQTIRDSFHSIEWILWIPSCSMDIYFPCSLMHSFPSVRWFGWFGLPFFRRICPLSSIHCFHPVSLTFLHPFHYIGAVRILFRRVSKHGFLPWWSDYCLFLGFGSILVNWFHSCHECSWFDIFHRWIHRPCDHPQRGLWSRHRTVRRCVCFTTRLFFLWRAQATRPCVSVSVVPSRPLIVQVATVGHSRLRDTTALPLHPRSRSVPSSPFCRKNGDKHYI